MSYEQSKKTSKAKKAAKKKWDLLPESEKAKYREMREENMKKNDRSEEDYSGKKEEKDAKRKRKFEVLSGRKAKK